MPESCGRLVAVVAFYVFSCSYFRGPKNRRKASHDSQNRWREEVEAGPSFLRRNNNSRQSSRQSSSRQSSLSAPSTANSSAEAKPVQLQTLFSDLNKSERITTVTVTQLPRIHPPVNEYHPPVVSALPDSRTDTAWMRLPPPTARAMRAINRVTHSRRGSMRGAGDGTSERDGRMVSRSRSQEWALDEELDGRTTGSRSPRTRSGKLIERVEADPTSDYQLKSRQALVISPGSNSRFATPATIEAHSRLHSSAAGHRSPHRSPFVSTLGGSIQRPQQVLVRPCGAQSAPNALDDNFYSDRYYP